jgi:putative membrane protein
MGACDQRRLEGIIAERADSPYPPGQRSEDRLKGEERRVAVGSRGDAPLTSRTSVGSRWPVMAIPPQSVDSKAKTSCVNETTPPTPVRSSPAQQPHAEVDLRQQLAADRTLLAWIRTAVALAALGFVVARFNLALREIQHAPATPWHAARYLGLAVVVAAAALLVIGVVQHRQVTAALIRDGERLPAPRWPAIAAGAVASLAIVAVGVYLATGVH